MMKQGRKSKVSIREVKGEKAEPEWIGIVLEEEREALKENHHDQHLLLGLIHESISRSRLVDSVTHPV